MVRHADTEMTVMKEDVSRTQSPKAGGTEYHDMGVPWGSIMASLEAEGARGKCGQEPLLLWFH